MAAREQSVNLAKLTEPFPPNKVKQKRGQGNRTMSYISHGLVTERLNDADPNWSSEILTEHTYKDGQGRLHCEGVTLALTVNGVTRVEAGGPQRQDGFTNEIKNAYSDALKRAAMRFGVALEMWESLLDAEGDEDYDDSHAAAPQQQRQAPQPQQQQQLSQYNWQDFWTWARSQNLGSPQAIEGVINQPISGLSPNQIRDAILHAQAQQRPSQPPQNGNGQRPHENPPVNTGDGATQRQLRYLQAVAREAGMDAAALDALSQREFGAAAMVLTRRDCSALIDRIQNGQVEIPMSGPQPEGQDTFRGMPEPSEPDEEDYDRFTR